MATADRLTIKEVARYLGLSESSVRGLIARSDLRAEGWPLPVERAELESYIAGSRIEPGELGPTCNQYRRSEPSARVAPLLFAQTKFRALSGSSMRIS